jgi:hypothetical protein
MMSLFHGHKDAYGTYHTHGDTRADGKVKGHGVTERKAVTRELWDDHLNGKTQLGIIPINDQSMCRFGAIDIDDYAVNRKLINLKIYKHKLPCIAFRSKSGGVHLFFFFSEPVPARVVQDKLREFASFLGYGTAEIFPKQYELHKERGDVGQWINMPYFNANETVRFATQAEDDRKLSLEGFIGYVGTRCVSRDYFQNFQLPISQELSHGPPCLQHLIQQGFPDGTRNIGLFQLGIYAQKAFGDEWRKRIEEFNQQYMQPPLNVGEVTTIVRSLEKKEYNYACKKPPICNHCNSSICRTRKFGVGEGAGLPEFGTLTKINSDPPVWFLNVADGGRLELSTDDLQSPVRFQKRCMDVLNIMPTLPKRQEWQAIIGALMENVNVVDVPVENTPRGRMMQYLEEFCVNRGTEDAEGLLRGLVWNNGGQHHFRLKDFQEYLNRKKFFDLDSGQLVAAFRESRWNSRRVSAKRGKAVACYVCPLFLDAEEEYTPPTQTSDIPY